MSSAPLDETTVLRCVADHFRSAGSRVWYSRRGLSALPYPWHEIAIGGFYPDLLCLSTTDEVTAVEAKRGGGDLAKGLGQALLYQRGAQHIFLAAPTQDLLPVQDVALSHGVGLLEITHSGLVRETRPETSLRPRFLRDVQHHLLLLEARAGLQVRHLGSTALILNHPLHYLVPVLLTREGMSQPDATAAVATGWVLNPRLAPNLLLGAQLLGLISLDRGSVSFTSLGQLVRRMLESVMPGESLGQGPWSTLTRSGAPLIDQAPLLGGVLHFLYREDPDIRELQYQLDRAGGELSLDQLILHLLHEAPNVVLQLFCSRNGRDELLRLLQEGRENEAVEPAVLNRWLLSRSVYELKRQLIHVGVLQTERAHGSGKANYDPSADIWRLRQ